MSFVIMYKRGARHLRCIMENVLCGGSNATPEPGTVWVAVCEGADPTSWRFDMAFPHLLAILSTPVLIFQEFSHVFNFILVKLSPFGDEPQPPQGDRPVHRR